MLKTNLDIIYNKYYNRLYYKLVFIASAYNT